MNSKFLQTLGFIFLCFLHLTHGNQDMITSLTVEVQKIAASVPPNGGSYVNGIQSHGVINTDSFEISQTVSILQKKLQLPQEVVEKFKNIIFADSINFETFSLSINVNEGYITEFIGTARKEGNIADIAYITVSSSGNLVAQYQTVETRSCHRVALWKKCHTNTQQIPRGFNAQEIEVITNTLRGSAYQYVLDQLKTPPVAITNFDQIKAQLLEDNKKNYPALFLGLHEIVQTDGSDDGDALLEDLVKSVLAKVPEMKAEITRDGDVVVNKIVNRGFNSYQQTANIEQYYGVAEENIDMFLDNLIGDLMLPEAYRSQFESIVDDVVYADLNEWLGFDVAFSLGNGASCKYVCVLARKNGKKIDWLVANILANFDLAPSIFVVQETKSVGPFWGKTEEKVRFTPTYITQHQLEIVFDFFQIITFTRFAEVLNIEVPKTLALNVFAETATTTPAAPVAPTTNTTTPTDIKTKVMSALDMVKTGITSVTSLWTSVVNAFKTTKSSELKQILSGKGFSYFSQSSQVQKIIGLKAEYYTKFKTELLNRLQVPADKQYDFGTVLDDFQYMDEQTWTAYQSVFSVGQNGECKFVTILAHRNETSNKIDFLLSDMKATFKLAPDVLVIQDSKSVLGGIYSDSKIRLQEMPRSLTNDDLKAVFDFFYIVAFKNFADLFGIQVDLPTLN